MQYKYEYYYSGINPVEFQGHYTQVFVSNNISNNNTSIRSCLSVFVVILPLSSLTSLLFVYYFAKDFPTLIIISIFIYLFQIFKILFFSIIVQLTNYIAPPDRPVRAAPKHPFLRHHDLLLPRAPQHRFSSLPHHQPITVLIFVFLFCFLLIVIPFIIVLFFLFCYALSFLFLLRFFFFFFLYASFSLNLFQKFRPICSIFIQILSLFMLLCLSLILFL